MASVIISILLYASYFFRAEGLVPPGLTTLKKCNKYYNAGLPEETFSPLTKEDWYKMNAAELSYTPALGIAGGEIALPKQLPFMAALGYENNGRKEFACGGTLISEQFVLTAAHCIHSRHWGKIRYIRLGDLNLTSSADDSGAQEFQLKKTYVHPNYEHPLKYHDIALVELDRPVDFSEYVFPACLEPKRRDIRYKTFYVAGWGNLGHGEDASHHLQVATLIHYQGAKCQATFPPESTLPQGIKLESQVCAGGTTYKMDTCEGDSGGPLAYRHYTTRKSFLYMIAGVTSFGKACALAPIPAVYTRVSYYTDWIERIVWSNEFNDSDPDKIYFPDDVVLINV